MRRVLHTLYEYVAMWFGLGVLGLLCLLWSPFSWVLYRLQPQSAGGRLGRRLGVARGVCGVGGGGGEAVDKARDSVPQVVCSEVDLGVGLA